MHEWCMSITATAGPPTVITAKTVKRRFIVTANVATDAYGKTSRHTRSNEARNCVRTV